MSLMNWTAAEFGTSIGKTDAEHQQIFTLVNQLHTAVGGGDRSAIGAALDSLIDVVVKHFATEEQLMQEHGFPSYAQHKDEHDKLVALCADLQAKFKAGAAEVTSETTTLVRDWLCNHIPKVDKPYGPFLNAKGIA